MTYTLEDFRGWLARNRMHFILGNYDAREVTERAVLVGFDKDMVIPILSNFNDALAGTSIDRRAAASTKWFIEEVNLLKGRDLSEQWDALALQLTDGIDFE